MVAVVVEAAQQPAVERVVGGEPVTEGILRSGAAITVHIAHPTRRDAYLVEGKDVVLGKVAYRCWVQDDTSSSAFQQDIGAFVHFYVASGVAEDQRGGESAQRSPHYHDTWSRRSCIHLVTPTRSGYGSTFTTPLPRPGLPGRRHHPPRERRMPC